MKKLVLVVTAIMIVVAIYYFIKPEYQKEFYSDGSLKASYPIKDGVIEGQVKEYYPGGELKSEVLFIDGKQDGKAIFYYQDGAVEREVFFDKGVQNDTMKVYYENGELKELSYLSKGIKSGEFKSYYSNGELESTGIADNNERDGNWAFYDKSGELMYYRVYLQGKLISEVELKANRKFYQNYMHGYQFNYEGSFLTSKETNDYTLLTVDAEGFKPTINILKRDIDLDLKRFVDNELKSIAEITKDYKLIDLKSSEGNYVADYYAKYESLDVQVRTFFLREDESTYTITYVNTSDGFSDLEQTASKISETISFD